ncbi:MAG TPA: hypothetical protein VMF08_07960 [Candidatus Sulfotelmatobacter sp.]|nr:hypothetical protein [Candidatus Sulfotelmatobacter sp.]
MKEIRISLPRNPDFSRLCDIFEETIISSGLRITLKTTLGRYPGSTHWHVKSGNARGTLEITLWPKQGRAWFSIQNGRKAGWIQPKITTLKRQFVETLKR